MEKRTTKQINNMSFNELKNELSNCYNNPIKEKLIRELMLIKYNEHIILQQQNKTKKHSPSIKQKIMEPIEVPYNDNDFSLDDLDSNNSSEKINNFERTLPIEYNKTKIIEYDKDVTNNNLMARMDSDMEIKKMKVSSSKKDLIKPFVNATCDNYASFNDDSSPKLKSFKNKKV